MLKQSKSLNFVKYFLIFFLVSILIFLFSFTGFLKPAEGLFNRITAPVISFFSNISLKIKDIKESIIDLGNLQKENKELKEKNKELTQEIIRLKELELENESLKKQLGFIESVNYKTLAAKIIAREPSGFLKFIIINKGSKDGIKKNLAVTSYGFLVGKVFEVDNSTAKVILLTDSNFQISGMVQESQALGLVKGQIGSGLIMETIPKEKIVLRDNTIVTSNLENEIPPGLPIGKVTEVNQESDGLFQKASLSPFINLDEIRDVIVILSS